MGRLIDADYKVSSDGRTINTICGYMAPTVEAIPKADYENRLKADMVAMLEEISLEIEEKTKDPALDDYDCGFNTGIYVSRDIIQQKIDKLKGDKE